MSSSFGDLVLYRLPFMSRTLTKRFFYPKIMYAQTGLVLDSAGAMEECQCICEPDVSSLGGYRLSCLELSSYTQWRAAQYGD